MDSKILDCRIKLPSNILCIGKTNSGKSFLLQSIIEKSALIFDKAITKKYFVHKGSTEHFADFKRRNPEVIFTNEIPDIPANSKDICLVVYDDYMSIFSVEKNKTLNDIFTINTHHHYRGCTIVTLQASHPKNFAIAHLNTSYLVLFPNERNLKSADLFNRQIFPENKNFLRDCLKDVSKTKYGFIVVDITSNSETLVRNFLWPKMDAKIYLPPSK